VKGVTLGGSFTDELVMRSRGDFTLALNEGVQK
jgi:hypothetical protein